MQLLKFPFLDNAIKMKRFRLGSPPSLTNELSELGWLANGLANSGSKLEDSFWEGRLASQVDRLLKEGGEEEFTLALDQLFDSHPQAHDELAEMIEARAETTRLQHQGTTWDVLLLAVPVLAWSRYGINAGPLAKAPLQALKTQLGAHVLAKDAKLAMCEFLFSPDQLPQTFVDTHQLTCELGVRALSGRDFKINAKDLPETSRFLSDTRYLLAALAVPQGAPIFRWHEGDLSREQALAAWVQQSGPTFESLLTGSIIQPLLGDAYHAACRQADLGSRPYSIRASVAFLQTVFETAPDALRAVIGPCWDKQLEEYRVGFSMRDKNTVVHGLVWPLLGAEDEATETVAEIEQLLRDCGITEIVTLDHRFPLEYCDDCGVPLYPNLDAELVHAELPEEHGEQAPRLLH